MSVINEIEKQALSLPEQDRARLADRLIASLPEDFIDEDETEEAPRRDREMDENPDMVISLEELIDFLRRDANCDRTIYPDRLFRAPTYAMRSTTSLKTVLSSAEYARVLVLSRSE